MTEAGLPLSQTAEGVVVAVKLTPRAGRAGIDGVAQEPGPDGNRPVLKVRVTAPPEDGKANAALIALLAKAWRLPKTALTLVAGETQRQKRILVRGDSAALMAAITQRLKTE